VLNLRAAKRLGIEIPTSVLLRADEVGCQPVTGIAGAVRQQGRKLDASLGGVSWSRHGGYLAVRGVQQIDHVPGMEDRATPSRRTGGIDALSRWRHEHVANAAHSANGVGMRRIGFDLAAQASDAQVDGAVERLHLAVCSHLQ
jgi:hypothetical protein